MTSWETIIYHVPALSLVIRVSEILQPPWQSATWWVRASFQSSRAGGSDRETTEMTTNIQDFFRLTLPCVCIAQNRNIQLLSHHPSWHFQVPTRNWAPRPSGSRQRLFDRDLSSARPRRDRDVCQTVRDETETLFTLECPRRDRDETFFWSRLYRDTWLKYAWYMHFTLCPKKKSLRLGWKKQVNNKQSLILKILKTSMFSLKK